MVSMCRGGYALSVTAKLAARIARIRCSSTFDYTLYMASAKLSRATRMSPARQVRQSLLFFFFFFRICYNSIIPQVSTQIDRQLVIRTCGLNRHSVSLTPKNISSSARYT